jgi:hypothetical protein
MKLETNASEQGWDIWMVIDDSIPADGTYYIGEVDEDYAKELVKRVNLHDELVEALDEAEAFLGAMFGQGPDAIVPEKVMLPLGVECDLGGIVRDLKATLAKARA